MVWKLLEALSINEITFSYLSFILKPSCLLIIYPLLFSMSDFVLHLCSINCLNGTAVTIHMLLLPTFALSYQLIVLFHNM